MPMNRIDRDGDDPLDLFFQAARTDSPAVSDTFAARVLADAARHMPRVVLPKSAHKSTWAGFVDMLGGWPSVAGLASVAVAGIWIGVVGTDTLASYVTDPAYTLGDMMPGFDAIGEAG
jgi:hypothetical protein